MEKLVGETSRRLRSVASNWPGSGRPSSMYIVPPCENWDAKKVADEALVEFPDARPALERVLDIIDKDNKGRRRSPAFKAEAFAALVSSYERGERTTQVVEDKCRREWRPNDPEPLYAMSKPKTLWQNICATFRA